MLDMLVYVSSLHQKMTKENLVLSMTGKEAVLNNKSRDSLKHIQKQQQKVLCWITSSEIEHRYNCVILQIVPLQPLAR